MTVHVRPATHRWHTVVPAISDREFELFQTLIHRETGIFLSSAKKTLLVARLARRLRELRLTSFEAYYRRVIGRNSGDERVHLIDCICTNETHFFREPRQFEYIKHRIIPEWISQAAAGRRSREIRVWSAACSTGEEPYSIAMLLLANLPAADGWKIELLATDLSTRVIEQARKGVWSLDKAGEIPAEYLTAFMMKGTRSNHGKMKASQQLRGAICWLRLNLNDEAYAVTGPFDMIFCKNVLIYFDELCKTRVIKRLLEHIARSGYLFLGHAENARSVNCGLRCVIPTVYCIP